MKIVRLNVVDVAPKTVIIQKIFESEIGKEVRIGMQAGRTMPEHKALQRYRCKFSSIYTPILFTSKN